MSPVRLPFAEHEPVALRRSVRRRGELGDHPIGRSRQPVHRGIVAVLLVEPRILAATDAPLALLYEQATGRRPVVIALISMAAVVNGGASSQGGVAPMARREMRLACA